MRPILMYDGYAAGGGKVFTCTPFTYTQVGATLSSDTGSAGAACAMRGKVIQFQDTLYVLNRAAVKRLNRSDGSWTTLFSLSTPHANDNHAQMLLCNVNGVYYLAVVYANSTSNSSNTVYRMNTYNFSTGAVVISGTVTEANNVANTSSSHLYYFDGFVWFSRLTGFVEHGNVSVGSLADVNLPFSGSNGQGDFCAWNRELYFISCNSSNSAKAVYKLVGSTFVSIGTLATVAGSSTGTKPHLFTNGTYLYALFITSAGLWRMFRISQSSGIYAFTEVTSTVIPSFSGQATNSRFYAIVDQHENPLAPRIYLAFSSATDDGSMLSFYEFIDDTRPLVYIGSAGNGGSNVAVSNPKEGGGDMQYTVSEPNIQIEGLPSQGTVPGNVKISFRTYETSTIPSGAPIQVRLYYSPDKETPTTRAFLQNPLPSGTIINGDTLTGIVATSGTLYSVEWRALANGLAPGSAVSMIPSMSGVM